GIAPLLCGREFLIARQPALGQGESKGQPLDGRVAIEPGTDNLLMRGKTLCNSISGQWRILRSVTYARGLPYILFRPQKKRPPEVAFRRDTVVATSDMNQPRIAGARNRFRLTAPSR